MYEEDDHYYYQVLAECWAMTKLLLIDALTAAIWLLTGAFILAAMFYAIVSGNVVRILMTCMICGFIFAVCERVGDHLQSLTFP